jgi:uncharacterized protein YoxC
MKEHFRLSFNFEETMDGLGHQMEEILAQAKSLATKEGRLEEQLDELISSSKMRANQVQQDLEEALAFNSRILGELQN